MNSASIIHAILHYLLCVVVTTAFQIFILIGPGLILAFLIGTLSRIVEVQTYLLFGHFLYRVVIGGLGTIVHESGHYLFCVLFRHKIIGKKFLNLDLQDPRRGYVNHAFSWSSPYQVIGNFFIGIGPIILGALVTYYSTWFLLGPEVVKPMSLVKINSSAFNSLETLGVLGLSIVDSTASVLRSISTCENIMNWKFYVFLYITLSIASSITLSMPDVKGTLLGFIVFVTLLFLFNLVTIWMGYFTEVVFMRLSQLYSCFYAIMIFTLIMNTILAVVLFHLGSLLRH